MVRLLLLLLVLAGSAAAQDRDKARLELVLDPREAAPLEGEMVLSTLRGIYRQNITREEVKLRPMTDFDWVRLGLDSWTEERIDGLPARVFERRLAFYPRRDGTLEILPIAHRLEVLGAGGKRETVIVRSDPVTLTVDQCLVLSIFKKRILIASILTGIKDVNSTMSNISFFIHGTTVATNAILQKNGANTALICTEGFKDLLDIKRGNRSGFGMLRADWVPPPPIIPRRNRLSVNERISYDGKILTPVNKNEIYNLVNIIKERKIESVVISLLNSYINPVNEQKIKNILIQKFIKDGIDV